MNITQKTFSLLFLVTTITPFADTYCRHKSWGDFALSSISTTYPIYWLEKNFATMSSKHIDMAFGDVAATPYYQGLGKEAQFALGIPEEYHVPIKQILPNNPMAHLVSGLACPHAIYLNEEKLNQQPYGVQRCAVYHEAVHKKYSDFATNILAESIALFGSAYGAHKMLSWLMPQSSTGMHVISTGVWSIIGSMMICSKYPHYQERRADTDGFYATECAICVQEMMAHRHQKFEVENHPFKNNGYLSAHEIEPIVQDLQEQNKVCTYHKRR